MDSSEARFPWQLYEIHGHRIPILQTGNGHKDNWLACPRSHSKDVPENRFESKQYGSRNLALDHSPSSLVKGWKTQAIFFPMPCALDSLAQMFFVDTAYDFSLLKIPFFSNTLFPSLLFKPPAPKQYSVQEAFLRPLVGIDVSLFWTSQMFYIFLPSSTYCSLLFSPPHEIVNYLETEPFACICLYVPGLGCAPGLGLPLGLINITRRHVQIVLIWL